MYDVSAPHQVTLRRRKSKISFKTKAPVLKLSITKEKSTPSLKTGVMVHDRPTPKTKMAPKTKMPPKRPKLMPPTKIIKTQLKSSRAPSAPVPVMAHDQYTFDTVNEEEVANAAKVVESSRFQLFGLLAGGGLLLGVLSIIGLFKLIQLTDDDDIDNDMKEKL